MDTFIGFGIEVLRLVPLILAFYRGIMGIGGLTLTIILLKQPLNSPMPVEEQVLMIWSANEGYLDDVDLKDVKRFETELLAFVKGQHATALEKIRTVKDIKNDDVKGAVKTAVEAFKRTFQSTAK
jgi:F0F1-type ATP synthase alpha subunit